MAVVQRIFDQVADDPPEFGFIQKQLRVKDLRRYLDMNVMLHEDGEGIFRRCSGVSLIERGRIRNFQGFGQGMMERRYRAEAGGGERAGLCAADFQQPVYHGAGFLGISQHPFQRLFLPAGKRAVRRFAFQQQAGAGFNHRNRIFQLMNQKFYVNFPEKRVLAFCCHMK